MADTKLNNRINMIGTTIGFCDLNPTPTNGILAWAAQLADVKAKKVLIDGYNQIGNGSTKGVTTDTKILKLTMTKMAYKCARATLGYANSINNNTLREIVKISESDLNKLSKEDVDDKCQDIHDAAQANSAGGSELRANGAHRYYGYACGNRIIPGGNAKSYAGKNYAQGSEKTDETTDG